MNLLRPFILTVAFTVIAPALALAAVLPNQTAYDDDQLLQALETKFYAHTDRQRKPLARLQNMECFVFGSTRTGSVHDRVAALAASAHVSVAASTPIPTVQPENELQPQLRHQLQRPPIYLGQSIPLPMFDAPAPCHRKKSLPDPTSTLADRIEWLEVGAFGHKDCAGKLQARVDRLEQYLKCVRADNAAKSLSERVDRLCATMSSSAGN